MGGQAPGLDAFESALDSSFQVAVDDAHSSDVILVEVTSNPRPPGWESFSLLFAGPRPAFAQGLYDVSHPATGRFPIFLVPVVSEGEEQHYEAVFNRELS